MSEAQIKALLNNFQNYSTSVSDREFEKIRAKTLIVLGDHDNVIPIESVSFARKYLPESYLWILPDTEHGAHEGKNKIGFVRVSKEFFSQNWHK